MKYINWFFRDENWKIVIPIILVIGFPLVIYQIYNQDERLSDKPERDKIERILQNELNQVNFPEKVKLGEFENWTKPYVVVRLEQNFKTQLPRDEIRNFIIKELERNGWTYYGYNTERPRVRTDVFCKNEYDASLSLASKAIWAEDIDHYELNFSYGFRDIYERGNKLPEKCKKSYD